MLKAFFSLSKRTALVFFLAVIFIIYSLNRQTFSYTLPDKFYFKIDHVEAQKQRTLKMISCHGTMETVLKESFVLSRFIISYAIDILCQAQNIDYSFAIYFVRSNA